MFVRAAQALPARAEARELNIHSRLASLALRSTRKNQPDLQQQQQRSDHTPNPNQAKPKLSDQTTRPETTYTCSMFRENSAFCADNIRRSAMHI